MRYWKKLYEVYEYIYYRIYMWQLHLHGDTGGQKSAAFFIPGLLSYMTFIFPLERLTSIPKGGLYDWTTWIIIIYLILGNIYMGKRWSRIRKKFWKESKQERRMRTKQAVIVITLSLIWFLFWAYNTPLF